MGTGDEGTGDPTMDMNRRRLFAMTKRSVQDRLGGRVQSSFSFPHFELRQVSAISSLVGLSDHAVVLCGSHVNHAAYGSCIASGFDSLHVQGLPASTSNRSAYAGLDIQVQVRKQDTYSQLMVVDSSSTLQVFSSRGDLQIDPGTAVMGSSIEKMIAGVTTFSVALEPSFKDSVFAKNGSAELMHQPFVFFEGTDVSTNLKMQTDPLAFIIQSEIPCPTGYILELQAASALGGRPGACKFCAATSYSLDPLASASETGDPACINCPGYSCTTQTTSCDSL